MQSYRRGVLSAQRFLPALRRFSDLDRGEGSLRAGGGAWAKKEQAQEDQYFRRQTADQLKHLHDHHEEEIHHHEEAIKRHQEAIDRHKKKITEHKKHSE
ncbi:ATPase inhibitor, mitochondrial-like [Corticium candelabrum]|uniref:ATPase inhibitor, mitochondrial-like n=1 Tax=Corticium candelabrum TaxID=121492 RepID=UPI002E25F31C|nr:ATPase inhibitor, mitochondrial-like [Corticium candelabrum]